MHQQTDQWLNASRDIIAGKNRNICPGNWMVTMTCIDYEKDQE